MAHDRLSKRLYCTITPGINQVPGIIMPGNRGNGAMSRKSIKRENGTGSVYKRKDLKKRPWVAAAPAKLLIDEADGKCRSNQLILGHYATAQEAKDALDNYRKHPSLLYNATLQDIHDSWMSIAYRRISDDLKNNYNSAWYKMRTLYKTKFRDLRSGSFHLPALWCW